jgi:hypothetical protein
VIKVRTFGSFLTAIGPQQYKVNFRQFS